MEKFNICTFRFTAAHFWYNKRRRMRRPPGDALVCAHKSKESLASWLTSFDEHRVRASSPFGHQCVFLTRIGQSVPSVTPTLQFPHRRSFIHLHTQKLCVCIHASMRFNSEKMRLGLTRRSAQLLTSAVAAEQTEKFLGRDFCSAAHIETLFADGVNYNEHYIAFTIAQTPQLFLAHQAK